jgi:gamma-glutamylaminecyclotransferase
MGYTTTSERPRDHAGTPAPDARRPMRVFVYGTLLAGEPNHHLLDGQQLVGEARTRARFCLVNLGPFPALVAGGEVAVRGEVYEVDASTLAALDRLEGYPGFYTRQPVHLDGEATGEALAYLLAPDRVAGSPEIPNGDWKAWRKERGQ